MLNRVKKTKGQFLYLDSTPPTNNACIKNWILLNILYSCGVVGKSKQGIINYTVIMSVQCYSKGWLVI